MMFNLDPEANVGFLLNDVSRTLRSLFDTRAQHLGLTRAQWRVLVHVAPREGLNQRALAEILEVENVTLGRHIDRLERDGWLERRRDPDDRRAWRIHLCERSRPVLAEMETIAIRTQSDAMKGMSPTEIEALLSNLVRVKSNIAAARTAESAVGA